LFDADPELASCVPSHELTEARRAAVAATVSVSPGQWISGMPSPEPGHLGFLLLRGIMSRELRIAGGRSVELLGTGDIVRPWQEDAVSFSNSRYDALVATQLAVLDESFARRMAGWPGVMSRLLERAVQRSRTLAALAAIGHVVGLEQRVEALFWCLAERWGRVSYDGVTIALPLTHQTLAGLVGAQRPSVTTALGELARAGRLTRSDGVWTLRGDPPPFE
jgi:CRP-like cAMP-binding protein